MATAPVNDHSLSFACAQHIDVIQKWCIIPLVCILPGDVYIAISAWAKEQPFPPLGFGIGNKTYMADKRSKRKSRVKQADVPMVPW